MNVFVADVLSFARPIFLDAVRGIEGVTPIIESVGDEVRLTLHGLQRNGRDVGIRIYQLETITRFITTLDPIDRADVSRPLRPSLRYASTPEWLTIRGEATGFDYGEAYFEIVLFEFLIQLLDLPSEPGEPLALTELRQAMPDAIEHSGHLRINTGSFCRAAVDVELRPSGEWVHATAPVANVVLREAQRLRLNDYTTFFRTKQDGDRLVVEGEFPAAMVDGAGMRWLAAQIAMTSETLAKNLSMVADVS
jgi:hypothetical protein